MPTRHLLSFSSSTSRLRLSLVPLFSVGCSGTGANESSSLDAPDEVVVVSTGGTSDTGGSESSGGSGSHAEPGAGGGTGGAGSGSSPGIGGTGTGGEPALVGTPVCVGADLDACDEWVKTTALADEKFEAPSLANWLAELQSPGDSSVQVQEGMLDIDVSSGATIWFVPPFSGDVSIEYEITVVDQGGTNDRVSDLNQFWKASDPASADLFTHSGSFAEYDELLLYYVGMGGNNNSTTRLRKYPGDGSRDVLAEYLDSSHLLEGNKTYHIQILCFGEETQFIVDGVSFFLYRDSQVNISGNFGFRTVRSHMRMDNFLVHTLERRAGI